jgi:hypothetical protein
MYKSIKYKGINLDPQKLLIEVVNPETRELEFITFNEYFSRISNESYDNGRREGFNSGRQSYCNVLPMAY